MLFALGFDKIIFGHTPDLMSIIGSSIILGSAVVVTLSSGARKSEPSPSTNLSTTDVESQQALLYNADVGQNESDVEHSRVTDIQLRARPSSDTSLP